MLQKGTDSGEKKFPADDVDTLLILNFCHLFTNLKST